MSSRVKVGFLMTTHFPYLKLDLEAGEEQMFSAHTVDIDRFNSAHEVVLDAEEELLEGIEAELDELLSKDSPPPRRRADFNRYRRAQQLRERLNELRRRH